MMPRELLPEPREGELVLAGDQLLEYTRGAWKLVRLSSSQLEQMASDIDRITSRGSAFLVTLKFRFGIECEHLKVVLDHLVNKLVKFEEVVTKYSGSDLVPFLAYAILEEDINKIRFVLSRKPTRLNQKILLALAKFVPEEDLANFLLEKLIIRNTDDPIRKL